jgi:hypothetical protein
MYCTTAVTPIVGALALALLADTAQTWEDRARNPTEAEQKRLFVDWERSQVSKNHGRTVITIEGRLLLRSTDGKSSRPVDWVQPVGLVIAKSPGTHPDWSRGLTKPDTSGLFVAWANWDPEMANISISDGRFKVYVRAYEIRQPAGADGRCEVGLMLGRVSRANGQGSSASWGSTGEGRWHVALTYSQIKASWDNDTPVLQKSIGTVSIRGRVPINRTLSLINGTPCPSGEDYNPIALVRAVNHLRSLGKPAAIGALREYLRLADDQGYGGPSKLDPENIDDSNQWRLSILVPLVFEAADATLPPRRPNDIAVIDGIPLHTHFIGGFEGHPGSTVPLVDWAEAHGRVINGHLRPTDDPLAAVEKFLAQNPDAHVFNVRHVREQALRMLTHLGEVRVVERSWQCGTDRDWQELKTSVRRLTIRWDENKQEYVAK